MNKSSSVNLYEQVADKITSLIQERVFRSGDRLPSVRKLSLQEQVSISTVLGAYRLLEDRGRIEARPQSGYFVRPQIWAPPAEPEISDPSPGPTPVSIAEMVMQVVHAARRPGIVPFGAAVPSGDILPTRQLNRIMSAIGRRSPKTSGYEFPPGDKSLRFQIARRSLESGCTLLPEDIIITCGSQEALMLSLQTVAKAGDTIAIESPTYYGILQAIEVLGMRALEIPTHPRDGISLEALSLAIEQKQVKACLFVPNFNNPLGSVIPDEKKRQLLDILTEHQIPLIEDDIYGDLGFTPIRPKAAKAYDRNDLVLLCSSFSKTLAPGYRVGWIAPGRRYKQKIELLKFVNTVATATLPQRTIAEFLSAGGYDHYLRRVRKTYADQIGRFTEAISKFFPEGTKITRPAGGFVLWIELPRKVDSLKLFYKALEKNIGIVPGNLFSPKGKYKNFIRLNCGHLWSGEMEQALLILGNLAKDFARHKII